MSYLKSLKEMEEKIVIIDDKTILSQLIEAKCKGYKYLIIVHTIGEDFPEKKGDLTSIVSAYKFYKTNNLNNYTGERAMVYELDNINLGKPSHNND